METRKISSAAVAAALGGPATRPPEAATKQVRARNPESPELAAKRAAFAQANGATPPAAPPIGNATFDSIPPEIAERRAKVAAVRQALGSLIQSIRSQCAALQASLADLADDAPALRSAELFDPAEATDFLADLLGSIDKLSPPAKPAPKEKPAPKAPESNTPD